MNISLIGTERVIPDRNTNSTAGHIVFEPGKAVWLFAMIAGAVVALTQYFSASGLLVFLILSAITLCAGHSVGMHRLLIHRSFEAPLWLERTLVYLGVLVGMAGPFGMIRAHDMRDWHQRQTVCPPHPSHGTHFLHDAYWQLCCSFKLDHPPKFMIEAHTLNDRFYRFLEQTWMLQQIPLAALLYASGGPGWVLWGICVRISVSLIGHWAIGHVAHKRGEQSWIVSGLPVQGYNLPKFAFMTFGESLHGNHHAFPHSAQLGIEKGQIDLGYQFIVVLGKLGLADNIKVPASEPFRTGLRKVGHSMEADSRYLDKSRIYHCHTL